MTDTKKFMLSVLACATAVLIAQPVYDFAKSKIKSFLKTDETPASKEE